jgi:hypothetical protein
MAGNFHRLAWKFAEGEGKDKMIDDKIIRRDGSGKSRASWLSMARIWS